MKKLLLLLAVLFSPMLILVIAFSFIFLIIFLFADSGDQLDKMYEDDPAVYGSIACSVDQKLDKGKWKEVWEDESLVGTLKGMDDFVLSKSEEVGVDPVLVTAIMMHETGKGTSPALKNSNNPAGVMDWDNQMLTIRKFPTLEEGITYSIENLQRRIYRDGLVDIESLANDPVWGYAPLGAKNDPDGLNKHWIPRVTEYAGYMGGFTLFCSGSQSLDMGDYTVDIKEGFAWVVPHTKHLTSGVGPRWGRQHKGIDIAWPGVLGTPVVSMLDGEVTKVHTDCPVGCLEADGCGTHTCGSGYGNHVLVQHDNGTYTRYGHLQDVAVKKGQKVKIGQLLGTVGSSGHSSGAHLHFEVRNMDESIIDPEKLLMEKGFKFTYN